jgi:DNA-binding NarL/FixJ family response regulator
MGEPAVPLRVLVVDDHLVIRHELRRLVTDTGATVVAEAGSVASALAMAAAHRPDVIVLDLHLPDGSGLDAIPRLQELSPDSRIVILTASNAAADIRRGLAAGASGYLTKDLSASQVAEAISSAGRGVTMVAGSAVASLLQGQSERTAQSGAAIARLSRREHEVLGLFAEGHSAAEVAELTGISVRTVEGHARSILNRLGARNRAEAVRIFTEAQRDRS